LAGDEAPRSGRPAAPRRSQHERREEAETTLGFGDDMPAFMRVSAKV